MSEIWKDIPGYEGRYQVSNLGRVKSLPRIVTVHRRNGTTCARAIKERILRPGPSNSGHLYVVLGHGLHGVPVHQLVLRAFVGEPPEKTEVRHLDGDPTNNRLENLCYGTRHENLLDEYRANRGSRTELTCENVLAIRALLAQGVRGRAIADRFGVSECVVSGIKTGRTFSWLK